MTLAAAHLTPSLGPGGVVTVQPPSEPLLWSYLVQLACALRSVHAHRLAARPSCLHPSKVRQGGVPWARRVARTAGALLP